MSVTPIRDPLPEGKLFIYSTPPGHFIYIDGKNTGQVTPDTIKWLKTNSYVVTLKRPLWRDTSFSMIASDNFLLDTNINLLSNPKMYGSIKFSSDPSGCSIYLNDSLLAQKTEFTLRHLLPRYYKVKYTKAVHRDIEKIFTVESNKQTAAYLAPQDTSIWVDYNTKNSNIPFDFLKCIAVDQNNIKWIGTYNQGIIRFDGENYEVINTSNSLLPTNRINKIIVGSDNKKWVCTENGLAVYDDMNWETFTKSNSPLPTNWIEEVEFADDGTIWVGTGNGLVKIKDGVWNSFFLPEFRPGRIDPTWVNGIEIINNEDIWFSTTAHSLYSFNENKIFTTMLGEKTHFRNYPDSVKGTPINKIVDLKKYDDKNLLFAFLSENFGTITEPKFEFGGISKLNTIDTTFLNYQFAFPPLNLRQILVDDKKNIWAASNDGLVFIKNYGSNYRYTSTNSDLPNNDLTSPAIDKNNIIWCTSFGGGLIKFKPSK